VNQQRDQHRQRQAPTIGLRETARRLEAPWPHSWPGQRRAGGPRGARLRRTHAEVAGRARCALSSCQPAAQCRRTARRAWPATRGSVPLASTTCLHRMRTIVHAAAPGAGRSQGRRGLAGARTAAVVTGRHPHRVDPMARVRVLIDTPSKGTGRGSRGAPAQRSRGRGSCFRRCHPCRRRSHAVRPVWRRRASRAQPDAAPGGFPLASKGPRFASADVLSLSDVVPVGWAADVADVVDVVDVVDVLLRSSISMSGA
jgi:hypothetical protein